MRIQILVKPIEGSISQVDCDDTETIETVKERISRSQKVPMSQFILLYSGKPLDLKTTLSYNGIGRDSTITMARAPRVETNINTMFTNIWTKGILLNSLKQFNKASDDNEIWEKARTEVNRYVVKNESIQWTLENLCIGIMGISNEMTELDNFWSMDNPYFGEEQRKSIEDIFKWNYIFLNQEGKTKEGLGKPHPESVLSKSYEIVLREFRSPETVINLDEVEHPSLALNENSNEHFIFDTMSYNKVETKRVNDLKKKEQEYRNKKTSNNKSEIKRVDADVQLLKNQSLQLKNGYLIKIEEFAGGLNERSDVIKSLDIRGELVFNPFFDNLKKDYRGQVDYVDLSDTILRGLRNCAGIVCLKFNLDFSSATEQSDNILKILQEIPKNHNLSSNLKYLDLSHTRVTSEILTAIMIILRNTGIEHLALNNCVMVDGGLDVICNAFAESSIISAELRGNHIYDEMMIKILKKFEKCKFLKRLDISYNPIGSACELAIKNFIRGTGITSLNISHTHIVQRSLNSILNFAECSQIEFIDINENYLKDTGRNFSTCGKILCCDFCRFWPTCGNSGCCIMISNCFAKKAVKPIGVGADQLEKAQKINVKAELIQMKKQLDKNVEDLINEINRRIEQGRLIKAVTDSQDFEAEQKKKEEEEKRRLESQKHQITVAEAGAQKMTSVNINTSNSVNDNKLQSQNNISDLLNNLNALGPRVPEKETEKPKILEKVPEEPEKKTTPNKADPADILEKTDGLLKNLEKLG